MRVILVLLLTFSSLLSLADTTDLRTLLYQADTTELDVNLSTEKTKTEYRIVNEPSICYRSEIRRRCTTERGSCRRVCNQGRCRRVCAPDRRVCRRVPVRVSYKCIRQVRRAFQVHDYYVDTNVSLRFDLSELDTEVAENFKITTTGDVTKISVESSKNVAIFITDEHRSESMRAGTKFVDQTFFLKLVPSRLINGALAQGIRNVDLDKGVLTFTLGENFNTKDFIQKLKVFQPRRLLSDILLLDKVLTNNDFSIDFNNAKTLISIDLNQLGINVPYKTRVIIETKYDMKGYKLLNSNDITTETSANWILIN